MTEFYNSGSTDQRTITENSSSLRDKFRLRSRVLVDVKKLDTSTICLGSRIKFPLGIAPAGIHKMAHRDGELAAARAATNWNIPMGISSFASYDVPDITGPRGSQRKIPHAMQLYPMQDRGLQERIIQKAEAAGCKAIFLTGDSPVLGVRFNEWRNDFRTPEGIEFPVLERDTKKIRSSTHDEGFNSFNDDGHSWTRDIPWLRQKSNMEIWIKGVLCAEDVELAIKHGVDGVIISNHGGRQLDGVPATIDVLEECVDAAKGSKLKIHVDGGFRRGSDIFVALALGAECVWVGRPTIWGLAYDGQKGVERMIEILYEDFRRTMALCGCVTVADINRSCLRRMGTDGILRPLVGGESQRFASKL